MRRSLLFLLVVVTSCASAPAPAPAPGPAPAPALAPPPAPASAPASADPAPVTPAAALEDPALVHASNAFTTHLFARVKRTPGNVMISATSLRTALGVALLGARSNTAREMAAALDFPTDEARAAAAARAETAAWSDARGKADLIVANRVWSDKAFPVKDDFTATATASFGAGLEALDFANAPDVARRSINAWVAEKTADKITDVLAEGSVDKSTRLVVTNAIYFKARWSSPFTKSATKDERFTAAARSADVPTMHATGLYGFAHVGAAKVLGMRYDGTQLGMLVVLPDEVAGLTKLEESLAAETFEAWTKALASQRVAISLPRFAFKWGGSLDTQLKELGMREAFSPKADFSGISDAATGSQRLQISRVVQKTWVSVDENGTEAAAASGIAMSVTSALMGPIADFKADHPFLFFVYDVKRGRILFSGRVADPRS